VEGFGLLMLCLLVSLPANANAKCGSSQHITSRLARPPPRIGHLSWRRQVRLGGAEAQPHLKQANGKIRHWYSAKSVNISAVRGWFCGGLDLGRRNDTEEKLVCTGNRAASLLLALRGSG
jgi:hypothetical protein